MNYSVEIIHPAYIDWYWEELLPCLQLVVEVSHEELALDVIREKALFGNCLFIVIKEEGKIIAATTAEVVTYDSGLRSLLIPIIGGTGLLNWGEEWFEMMKHLAKYLNCNELRGFAARDGWLKLLKTRGWKEVHTVITYKLDQE